jgi:ceramide glucosyltransferase
MIGGVLSMLALAWSSGLACTAAWAALRSSRPNAPPSGTCQSAILVRPCAGGEPALLRALISSGNTSRSSPLSIRFAVARVDDGAATACETTAARLRASGLDASVVVTDAVGPNRKADQIARTLAQEATLPPVVIIADSDVDLTGVSLDALTGPLSNPGVAAVWAAPVEIAPRTLADRASAAVLDASMHAFPVLAALDPGGMVGKLVAIRRDALEAVGGFGALVGHLGEDMELARRLHAAGWQTRLAPLVAPSLAQGRSWSDAVQRYARWITVIRTQRPHLLLTYPAIIVATPIVVAVSLGAAALGAPLGLAAAVLALGSRFFLGLLARKRSGRPVTPLALPLDIVLADALLLTAFVRAIRSRRTVWRGVELRVDAQTGTLTAGAS